MPAPDLAPAVAWNRPDHLDTGDHVDATTILHDYREPDDPRTPVVYQTYLPLGLLRVELCEDLDGGSYDWAALAGGRFYPPLKVILGARWRPRLFLKDGHHRVTMWRQDGYLLAPCWVLDYSGGGG